MIRVVDDYDDALDILNYYSARLASLREGRVKPEEMAKKFVSYGTVLEAVNEQDRIGFSAFYHNDREGKRAFLSMIAVSSEYEGKGYASRLLNEVESISASDGMEILELEVNESNLRAIDFYKKHGYRDAGSCNGRGRFMKKTLKSTLVT